MIEFELKYKLSKIPKVFGSLQILKTIRQSDIYYDTKNYDLIKKGNFFRIRDNNILDFKIDLNDTTHSFCKETSFNITEIYNKNNEINQLLIAIGLSPKGNVFTINEFLEENEFHELAKIDKIRKMYKLDNDCTLCVDYVDNLGLFLEAEIMIDKDTISQEEAELTKNTLIKHLKDVGIIDETTMIFNTGYVELYLLTHNTNAYGLGKFKI
jgi:adenylate cyclase class IV